MPPSDINRLELIESPFVVAIDTREQLAYGFADMRTDAHQGKQPLLVRRATVHLPTGDYSLCEEGTIRVTLPVAVERKTLADLFSTLGQERDRFERELARLDALEVAAVVVEASWHDILFNPPERSQLNPKTIHRSVIAWQQRYPRVHWWMCGDRRLAEITTFRILERYWREHGRTEGGTAPNPG